LLFKKEVFIVYSAKILKQEAHFKRMNNTITEEKIKKYFSLTTKALKIAKKSIMKGKDTEAKEILEMAYNYLNDAEYFEKNQDLVNAFGAINYAHGWIDSGARLGIFDVKDDKLFTTR